MSERGRAKREQVAKANVRISYEKAQERAWRRGYDVKKPAWLHASSSRKSSA